MVRFSSTVALVAVSLLGPALAHPGHDINAEIEERAAFLSSPEYRSLDHCAAAIKARDAKMIERRMNIVNHQRRKRGLEGIEGRSYEDVLATNHKSTKLVTPDSSAADVFGSNNSCILQAETTEGPYCSLPTY